MNRRAFLGALALFASARSAEGQRVPNVPRIGFISTSTTSVSSPLLAALRQGLSDRGYVEGKSIVIEYRFPLHREEVSLMAAELVNLPVDLIVAGGSESILAARRATSTIPIVMTNSGDAVAEGFAASLARPGGNTTGLTQMSPELAGKRLEILKEAVPRLRRVAVLWHPLHPNTPATFKDTQRAAGQLGLSLHSLAVKNERELREAFETATSERADGLVVLRDPFMVRHRVLVADNLTRKRLPAIYETGDFVQAGGLMMYGPNFAELYRRAAGYIDKILKGARPEDVPVEQPTKFDLVINLKAAKGLGLTIPPSLLLRADQVIE
jgi:putative tryptophan/tyrosine transport system substrate-binding protein